MIQKFNQFINESSAAERPLSIHEEINEPFTLFIERAQERLDNFTEHITYLLNQMDKAIGEVLEDFEYAVVGEPTFNIASDLEEIEVQEEKKSHYEFYMEVLKSFGVNLYDEKGSATQLQGS